MGKWSIGGFSGVLGSLLNSVLGDHGHLNLNACVVTHINVLTPMSLKDTCLENDKEVLDTKDDQSNWFITDPGWLSFSFSLK